MITGQHDQLFPSISKLSQWYENQLVVTTTYVKALMRHFNVKEIDLHTLHRSGLFQLLAKGVKKKGDGTPSRIEFRLGQKASKMPHTEIVEEQKPTVSIVGQESEVPLDVVDTDFDYDDKITQQELSLLSVNNVETPESDKGDDDAPMSIVTLARFYEAKIDLMSKIAKSIMIASNVGEVNLDWLDGIERSANTQLHVSYNMLDGKEVQGISLRLSDGNGPTTYGFAKIDSNPKKTSTGHLKVVT